MKYLYALIINSILITSMATAGTITGTFSKFLKDKTFEIKHEISGANEKCLTPSDGPTGDPFYDGQQLSFIDCSLGAFGKDDFKETQDFMYKNGKKLQSSINSIYGSGKSHNYCVSLSERYGTATLQTCDENDHDQDITIDFDLRDKLYFRSYTGMCLAEGDDGTTAVAVACNKDDQRTRMKVDHFYEATKVNAENESSFKWVKVDVDKRLWSGAKYSYSQTGTLDTSFIFPGVGTRVDAKFKSLGWASQASAFTDEGNEGELVDVWVDGYWHLYGHAAVGLTPLDARMCTTLYITYPTGWITLLKRTINYTIWNSCNKAVTVKFVFKKEGGSEFTEDLKVWAKGHGSLERDEQYEYERYSVSY